MIQSKLQVIVLMLLLAAASALAMGQGDWKTVGGLYQTYSGLFRHDSSLYVGAQLEWGHAGLFRSTDEGETWLVVDTTLGQVRYMAFLDTVWFVGTGTYGLYRSTDDGKNWSRDTSVFLKKEITAIEIVGQRVFVLTYYNGLYQSSDGGTHWMHVDSMPETDCNAIHISGTKLFLGTVGGVYTSADSGTTWLRYEGARLGLVMSLFVDGNKLFAAKSGGELFRSLDGGMTWDTVVPANQHYDQFTAMIRTGTTLYAGVGQCQVEMSSDSGAHWTVIEESIAPGSILGMVVAKNNLLLSTALSALRERPLSELVEIDESPRALPTSMSLGNFPNPFSATTEIEFSLPQSQLVTLKIFNGIGQEISTLVNGACSGRQSVAFDTKGLKEGVYWIRMSAGKELLTQRMVHVH